MSEQKDIRYLVTGGCGFLGRHLLQVLLEKEDTITEIRLFDKHIDLSLQDQSTGKRNLFLIPAPHIA